MKLDENNLADTPVFAQLVRETAVGRAGALELLSDDYQPPKPLILGLASAGDEDSAEDEGESSPAEDGIDQTEIDAEGYPAIVNVAPVAPPTPPRGVRLIRPRALSDMQQS